MCGSAQSSGRRRFGEPPTHRALEEKRVRRKIRQAGRRLRGEGWQEQVVLQRERSWGCRQCHCCPGMLLTGLPRCTGGQPGGFNDPRAQGQACRWMVCAQNPGGDALVEAGHLHIDSECRSQLASAKTSLGRLALPRSQPERVQQ